MGLQKCTIKSNSSGVSSDFGRGKILDYERGNGADAADAHVCHPTTKTLREVDFQIIEGHSLRFVDGQCPSKNERYLCPSGYTFPLLLNVPIMMVDNQFPVFSKIDNGEIVDFGKPRHDPARTVNKLRFKIEVADEYDLRPNFKDQTRQSNTVFVQHRFEHVIRALVLGSEGVFPPGKFGELGKIFHLDILAERIQFCRICRG